MNINCRDHKFRIIRYLFFVIASLAAIWLAGCEALKSSKPIMPITEYERLLVGRLDADYIGMDNCLSACHFHDKIRQDFEASTMGAQLSAKSGMPLVDCETCHGPGSLAVKDLTSETVQADARDGRQTECNYSTFIDIKNLPPTAKSLMCLNCHTANATFNLHEWNAGVHAIEDVACSDCHDVHAGADLIVAPRDTKEMCFKCHNKIRADFYLRSKHPVNEQRILCTDCHDPHGTVGEDLLREDTFKETCTKCHPDVEGPFVYEHADIMENCGACHVPHGSPNDKLLITRESFLCLQCHSRHTANTVELKGSYYTRCTDCHSQIHGTDIPSTGGGRFIN